MENNNKNVDGYPDLSQEQAVELLKDIMRGQGYTTYIDMDGVEKDL